MSGRTDKRELIIYAAEELFSRFGYRKTSVDEIVRQAGVAKGTFYLYFSSKEKLFKDVMMEIRERMLIRYKELMSSCRTNAEKIETSLRFAFEALEDHPLFAKITSMDDEFKVAARVIDDKDVAKQAQKQIIEFQQFFVEGIKEGDLREDLDTNIVPIVFGAVKFMHFFKKYLTPYGLESQQITDTLLDLVMNGIKKK